MSETTQKLILVCNIYKHVFYHIWEFYHFLKFVFLQIFKFVLFYYRDNFLGNNNSLRVQMEFGDFFGKILHLENGRLKDSQGQNKKKGKRTKPSFLKTYFFLFISFVVMVVIAKVHKYA